MFRRTLFDFTTTGSVSSGGEIDLRAKFDEIVYGTNGSIPHGHKILIRSARRDSDGKPLPCTCKDPQTSDPTPNCSYCGGEGFLWDEEWIDCYSTYVGADGGLARRNIHLSPGVLRVDYKVFNLRYDTGIRYGDKLVEVKLDEEGFVVAPYQRVAIYSLETIQEYRSDFGRLEYFAVYCREDDAIRSDYV